MKKTYFPSFGRAFLANSFMLLWLWFFQVVFYFASVYPSLKAVFPQLRILLILAGFLLFPLVFALALRVWVKSKKYEVHEDGVMVYSGVVSRSQSLFLFPQIQDVKETQSLMDRIAGVKTLELVTMTQQSTLLGKMPFLTEGDVDSLKAEIVSNLGRKTMASGKTKTLVAGGAAPAGEVFGEQPYPIMWKRALVAGVLATIAFFASYVLVSFSAANSPLFLVSFAILVLWPVFHASAGAFAPWGGVFLKYGFSDDAVLIDYEFLQRTRNRISFNRIQDLLVLRGPLDWLLGLSAIKFETGEKPEIYVGEKKPRVYNFVPNLTFEDALKLRDFVLENMDVAFAPNKVPTVQMLALRNVVPLKKTLYSLRWVAIVVLVLFGVGYFYPQAGLAQTVSPSLGVSLLVAYVILRFAYEQRYLKNYFYDLQEKLFFVERGVFGREQVLLPYSKMQNVFVDQDIADRLFGLYDVHVSTVGAFSGVDARVDGLGAQDAEQLKKMLLKKIGPNKFT